jgi:hypothetical protein
MGALGKLDAEAVKKVLKASITSATNFSELD